MWNLQLCITHSQKVTMHRTGQIPFRISILISTMYRAGLFECQGDTPQP